MSLGIYPGLPVVTEAAAADAAEAADEAELAAAAEAPACTRQKS